MASSGLTAALIGAGGGLALLLLSRRSAAPAPAPAPAPETPSSTPKPSSDTCEALATFGSGAVASCKALRAAYKIGSGLLELLPGGPDYPAYDATNKSLNGEVELPLFQGLNQRSYFRRIAIPTATWPLLNGTVLRFKNGCTPFKDSPGWGKCAAGTKDMYRGTGAPDVDGSGFWSRKPADPWTGDLDPESLEPGKLPPASQKLRASSMFALTSADPTSTGPIRPGELDFLYAWQNDSSGRTRPGKFPVEIKPGEWGWWAAGVPVVCEEGAYPIRVRDHRTSGEAWVWTCQRSLDVTPPPRRGEPPTRQTPEGTPSNPPPGFVWVIDPKTGIGHWERKRAS